MLGLQLVLPNLVHLLKSLTWGREKLLSLRPGNALGSVSVDFISIRTGPGSTRRSWHRTCYGLGSREVVEEVALMAEREACRAGGADQPPSPPKFLLGP